MKESSFSRVIEKCDGQDVMMNIPVAIVKEWYEFGIARLIDRMDTELTLVLVAVVRL